MRAVALALALWPTLVAAQKDSVNAYVFGNSLVHHLSEQSDNTNVPYWLARMAKADGRSLGLDGQWGFLRNFADGLPPSANWSFSGVEGVWSPGRSGFGSAGFDAVMITPANFIQYQLPDVPYDGENPNKESPLGATLRVMDWVSDESPATRFYIYEGWSVMQGRFPPRARAFRRYHEENMGDYHLWYEDLVSKIATARPDYDVTLIPVASTLAGLMAPGGPLEDVPPVALYEDSAPHGTPTLYFLAAMVTYAWLFETPPPAGFPVSATLHPDLVANYDAIAELIWAAAPAFASVSPADATAPGAAQEATAPPPLPAREAIALPPSGVRPAGVPVMGFGLNGIADWSTQHPFIDMMKTARGWVGHTAEGWGAYSTEALRAAGHLDVNDWPVSLPDGATALEAVLMTDQHEGQDWLRGDYVVTYRGKGDLELSGRAKRVRYGDGRITFTYAPGEGLVGIKIKSTDAEDPVRDITVVKRELLPLHEAGALFNPRFLEVIEDARSVRFMDWMNTNGSPVMTWDDRPTMELATWTEWGVPVEVMVRLANVIGADPWFCMPHGADDAYVRRFAETVKRDLDPRLKAHVEYSNEVWNQIFPQAVYARERATALWGESELGWMQYYGLRSAQVMDIWSEVFGAEADARLVRVMATHTGWPELEETILLAPLAMLRLGHPPVDSFDAYAVTGYFGYEMGGEDMARRMADWLDRSEAAARAAGEAEGLRRVALREYIKQRRFDAAIAPVAQALEEGSLLQLTDEVFPYHASAARRHGLRLVMYEGGTHVAAHGAQVNNERLNAFFEAFNYTPEMARLYEILLTGWAEAGGTLFNAFVDVAPASQWGSWGALRHLEDSNPRWDMLMAFNASGPDWESRDPTAFANGVRLVAGGGAERVVGTRGEDYLLAGGGNDEIVTGGGADVVHGGPGTDLAILPGTRAAYRFRTEGDLLHATGPDGTLRLFSVEQLRFDGGPETAVSVASLGG